MNALHKSLAVAMATGLSAGALGLTGCASLSVIQPTLAPTEPGSIAAETVWDALDAVDTVQTARFKQRGLYERDPLAATLYGTAHPSPSEVYAVNGVLMLGHSLVSSWLDRECAKHSDDASTGLWFVGRIAWHAISIGASIASVANNARLP